jgi:hypothetical protein
MTLLSACTPIVLVCVVVTSKLWCTQWTKNE